ncbi:MAG: hypothetical protein ACLUEV_01315 [Alistipes sp.]
MANVYHNMKEAEGGEDEYLSGFGERDDEKRLRISIRDRFLL